MGVNKSVTTHCDGDLLWTTVISCTLNCTYSSHKCLHSGDDCRCSATKYRALYYCSALGSLPSKMLFSEHLNPHETLSSHSCGDHRQPLSSVRPQILLRSCATAQAFALPIT
eukprot:15350426-Ditylum_brightwellii.AAC.1